MSRVTRKKNTTAKGGATPSIRAPAPKRTVAATRATPTTRSTTTTRNKQPPATEPTKPKRTPRGGKGKKKSESPLATTSTPTKIEDIESVPVDTPKQLFSDEQDGNKLSKSDSNLSLLEEDNNHEEEVNSTPKAVTPKAVTPKAKVVTPKAVTPKSAIATPKPSSTPTKTPKLKLNNPYKSKSPLTTPKATAAVEVTNKLTTPIKKGTSPKLTTTTIETEIIKTDNSEFNLEAQPSNTLSKTKNKEEDDEDDEDDELGITPFSTTTTTEKNKPINTTFFNTPNKNLKIEKPIDIEGKKKDDEEDDEEDDDENILATISNTFVTKKKNEEADDEDDEEDDDELGITPVSVTNQKGKPINQTFFNTPNKNLKIEKPVSIETKEESDEDDDDKGATNGNAPTASIPKEVINLEDDDEDDNNNEEKQALKKVPETTPPKKTTTQKIVVEKKKTVTVEKKIAASSVPQKPAKTETPNHSCLLRWRRGAIFVRVVLHKIPAHTINLDPTPTHFRLDTFKYSKKYHLDFPYPHNIKVDATKSDAKLESGTLEVYLSVTDWGDKTSDRIEWLRKEAGFKKQRKENQAELPKSLEKKVNKKQKNTIEKGAKQSAVTENQTSVPVQPTVSKKRKQQAGNSNKEASEKKIKTQSQLPKKPKKEEITPNENNTVVEEKEKKGKKKFAQKEASLKILDDIASTQEQQIENQNLKEMQKAKHFENKSKKAEKRKQKKQELRANSLAEATGRIEKSKKRKAELEAPHVPSSTSQKPNKSGKKKKGVSFKAGS